MSTIRTPELLAPAGDLAKLKTAIFFGANAVYFGGNVGSLRADASGLSPVEIAEAVSYCHSHDCKAYLAVNSIAHGDDLAAIEDLIRECSSIDIDAFIVSDPGVMRMIKRNIPGAVFHLSTQANVTNADTATFWHDIGVTRIVLARELSLEEIREIRANTPDTLELEAFIHGAMCISYSGRCLLSTYLTGRDGNRGECAQPCRWKYDLAIPESSSSWAKSQDPVLEISEDNSGTYILNSKDLCLAGRVRELADAGVISLKIEGRMKSPYYVATVTGAYRKLLDSAEDENILEKVKTELTKVSHREYTEGFVDGVPSAEAQRTYAGGYINDWMYLGTVLSVHGDGQTAIIEQRGKFVVGDTVEIFGPNLDQVTTTILKIRDEEGNARESAPHPLEHLTVDFSSMPKNITPGYLIRKYVKTKS
jgi:putative protease